jgi:hypothetical protein
MQLLLSCVGDIAPCRVGLFFLTLLVSDFITQSSWSNDSSRILKMGKNILKFQSQGRHDSRMSLDLLRGTGKLIGGDLDVDDEGFKQHQFKSMQSLHHGSVGYQPMHTRIGLAKKAMSLQAN